MENNILHVTVDITTTHPLGVLHHNSSPKAVSYSRFVNENDHVCHPEGLHLTSSLTFPSSFGAGCVSTFFFTLIFFILLIGFFSNVFLTVFLCLSILHDNTGEYDPIDIFLERHQRAASGAGKSRTLRQKTHLQNCSSPQS